MATKKSKQSQISKNETEFYEKLRRLCKHHKVIVKGEALFLDAQKTHPGRALTSAEERPVYVFKNLSRHNFNIELYEGEPSLTSAVYVVNAPKPVPITVLKPIYESFK